MPDVLRCRWYRWKTSPEVGVTYVISIPPKPNDPMYRCSRHRGPRAVLVRPTPIPDAEVPEGWVRFVMGPPPGEDPTGEIRSLEMLRHDDHRVVQEFRARIVLEDGDLEALAAGAPIWVSFLGGVYPFDVDLAR